MSNKGFKGYLSLKTNTAVFFSFHNISEISRKLYFLKSEIDFTNFVKTNISKYGDFSYESTVGKILILLYVTNQKNYRKQTFLLRNQFFNLQFY